MASNLNFKKRFSFDLKMRARLLLSLAILGAIATIFICGYDIFYPSESAKFEIGKTFLPIEQTSEFLSSSDNTTAVILPSDLDISNLSHFTKQFFEEFSQISTKSVCTQFSGKKNAHSLSESITEASYHDHTIQVFKSSVDINNDMEKCDALLKENLEVSVTKPQLLYTSLIEIVQQFILEGGAYYEEVKPFLKNLEKEINEGTLTKHWYRFIGSSIWLEQYQVHFMVSRIVYSPPGPRNSPLINFMYAQLFDKNWVELKNTELLVPTNNPDIGHLLSNEPLYKKLKYPMILPIPIYHNEKKQINYAPPYGPEDPRIVLVKNPKGYEEPVIVFNALHRKLQNQNAISFTDGDEVNIKFKYYRSMFMCWPWQTQRGKANVDDIIDFKFSSNLYLRIVELSRRNVERAGTQKNWTPFISFSDRQRNNYDESIYFIYEWNNLKVLKCDLSNIIGSMSYCDFDYQLESDSNEVGPLRGGTSLININDLLSRYSQKFSSVLEVVNKLPSSREVWVGFARAHMSDCGCIKQFYRPNLVVLIKDDDNTYKVSHVSSFISFDVSVSGWDLNDPKNLCSEKSVLIPNIINSWSLEESLPKRKSDKNHNIGFQDYLTLSITVSDNTIEVMYIKGLLSSLLTLDYTKEDELNRLFEYSSNEEHSMSGYNNDNVLCAMKESKAFCESFASVLENTTA